MAVGRFTKATDATVVDEEDSSVERLYTYCVGGSAANHKVSSVPSY